MAQPNIVDEKERVRELLDKLEAALVCNDFELSYCIFQLLGKHMGKLMSATATSKE